MHQALNKTREHVAVFINKAGNAYTSVGRPVTIMSEDGEVVEVVDSIVSCATILGMDRKAIEHACKNGYLLGGVYRVRFASLAESMKIEGAVRAETLDRGSDKGEGPAEDESAEDESAVDKAPDGTLQVFQHGQRWACRVAGPRGGKGKSTMYPLFVFGHGLFLCSQDADRHFKVARGCFGHAVRRGHQVYAEAGALRARIATRAEIESYAESQGFDVFHREDLDKGPPKRRRSPISKSVARRLRVQAPAKTDNDVVKEEVLAPVKPSDDSLKWVTTALAILENDVIDDKSARVSAIQILKLAVS